VPYDPETHHRRSIRLPEYDYAQAGAYFVTICVQQAEMLLGEVRDGVMVLNDWGRLVDDFWADVVGHFEDVAVDCHVTMPNHVHAVIVLVDRRERPPRWDGATSGAGVQGGETPPLRNGPHPRRGEVSSPLSAADGGDTPGGGAEGGKTPPPRDLAHVVAYYKYQTTRQINLLRCTPGVRLWQRSYWEHVIRNEADFARIREYVAANPSLWGEDTLRPDAAATWLNHRGR
jgi:REP element-mobilizing transposase RayT